MAVNTDNFGFKKPDESDFYDVQDQNGNWDIADQELEKLNSPTFEDYTEDTSVPEAVTAIEALKSKSKIGMLLSNIKAAFKGACLIGHIVNNCVTDNPGLPLSAAQGKALQDQLATLNSNLAIVSSCISNVYIKKIANEGEYTQVFATSIIDSSHFCGLVIADGGLYSFHNIGNVTALVNRSTYKVACNSVGKVGRLSITGMGTWDECVIISNRDFTLTHK